METKQEKRSHKRIGSLANPLKVNVKKVGNSSVIPTYAHKDDAGMDLYAAWTEYDGNGNLVVGTGIALEIPQGYVGLVVPRSSIANTPMMLANSIGIIDSGYRGEVTFKFACRNKIEIFGKLWDRITLLLKGTYRKETQLYITNFFANKEYKAGDRIGQLIIMPYPKIKLVEVEELSKTDRGVGGYGSTGK